MTPSTESILRGRGGISDAVVITLSEHEDHQRPKAVLYYVTPINYLPTHQRGRNHHLVVVAHAY